MGSSMLLQALVKVPLRRAHLADSIKVARTDRQGFVDLAAFLEWLWKLTAVPARYCQEMCMWLMDKLATLQMEDAMRTGQCVPHPPIYLTARSPAAGIRLFSWHLACIALQTDCRLSKHMLKLPPPSQKPRTPGRMIAKRVNHSTTHSAHYNVFGMIYPLPPVSQQGH